MIGPAQSRVMHTPSARLRPSAFASPSPKRADGGNTTLSLVKVTAVSQLASSSRPAFTIVSKVGAIVTGRYFEGPPVPPGSGDEPARADLIVHCVLIY